MTETLRLMAVLAHPDDESFAMGGALARYAAEGIDVHLVTATSGQGGRYFTGEDRPDDDEVGRVREEELREAAEALGVKEVHLLGYRDGGLDRVEHREATGRIVGHLRRVRPHVVVTFDPFGAYGHPDHVAICRLTTAAVVAAAGPEDASSVPHQVLKLYYSIMDQPRWEALLEAFEELAERMERREREVVLWPEWSISARINAERHWKAVWRAIRCHRSQVTLFSGLDELSEERHAMLWGWATFYRAFSLVNGGREKETDLFAGLR